MVVAYINPHYKDNAQAVLDKNKFRNPDAFEDIQQFIEKK